MVVTYNVLKATLHHYLPMNCGEKVGRLVYNLVMLDITNNVCRPIAEASSEVLNVDFMSEMIARMARRIDSCWIKAIDRTNSANYKRKGNKDELLPLSGLSVEEDLKQSECFHETQLHISALLMDAIVYKIRIYALAVWLCENDRKTAKHTIQLLAFAAHPVRSTLPKRTHP